MSDTSSSYGGSGASISDEESPLRAVVEQIEEAFNPIPLDRALVSQAQLSGILHSQAAELEVVRKQLQDQIPKSVEGAVTAKKLAKQVTSDLEWLEKHLSRLETRARNSYPIELNAAIDKVENPRRS